MRQTGGVAVGAISTRSTPLARAMFKASPSERIPSCLPSTPMTRTSRARIFPLTLVNEAEEEKLRGGKGRLKQPSPVETYSCRVLTTISPIVYPPIKHLIWIPQVNNQLSPHCCIGLFAPV